MSADAGVLVLARPEPRILHDILGFAGVAEHSVCDREQQRSMGFERRLVQSVTSVPYGAVHTSGPSTNDRGHL